MYRKVSTGLLAVALAASAAWAQGGAQNHQTAMGIGPGNTPGWSLMTPEERAAHRGKMMGFTKYEDCAAYVLEHHRLMQERAEAKGMTLPVAPRQNMCERLRHDKAPDAR